MRFFRHVQKQQQNTPAESADQALFVALVDEHKRMLLKVCWSYTRSSHDRDDLFQEIVSRLWRSFRTYDRSRPFSTWMYRVALNVAIDFHRVRSRREGTVGLNLAHDPPLPHDHTKQEQLEELHELLQRQNEVDRAILLLSLEGNSHAEIAEILGTSASNVGTRLHRVKKSLQQSVLSSTTIR
jgi:RNA polymerase sigma-70 factor (ECF subfamily)